MADKLAKEAAIGTNGTLEYTQKNPNSSVIAEIKEEGTTKWQKEWDRAAKGATCKKFFPSVRDRLKIKGQITPEFTQIVIGHGRNKAHLQRIGVTTDATCPC
ncbi:hypothetical protein C0J52_03763, partial [Blattella germanica]